MVWIWPFPWWESKSSSCWVRGAFESNFLKLLGFCPNQVNPPSPKVGTPKTKQKMMFFCILGYSNHSAFYITNTKRNTFVCCGGNRNLICASCRCTHRLIDWSWLTTTGKTKQTSSTSHVCPTLKDRTSLSFHFWEDNVEVVILHIAPILSTWKHFVWLSDWVQRQEKSESLKKVHLFVWNIPWNISFAIDFKFNLN